MHSADAERATRAHVGNPHLSAAIRPATVRRHSVDNPLDNAPVYGRWDRTAPVSANRPARSHSRITGLRRMLKHPYLRHYNRLIALVIAANLVLFAFGLGSGEWSSLDVALTTIAVIAQANLTLAVLLRQQVRHQFSVLAGHSGAHHLAVKAAVDIGEGVPLRRIACRRGRVRNSVVPGLRWLADLR
jgi:hypothetical protein